MRIADIPPEFLLRAQQTAQYPPHQNSQPLIEERALNYFKVNNINSDYIYLPIQWTEYLCNHNWGNDPQAVSRLQEVCDQITSQYPNEKFFTIVQFDGGTLTKINNCTIFSASGDFNSPKGENSPYIPIPLLCNPHQGEPRSAKNYKLGFAGRSNTHPPSRENTITTQPLLRLSHRIKSHIKFNTNHAGSFVRFYFRPRPPRLWPSIL